MLKSKILLGKGLPPFGNDTKSITIPMVLSENSRAKERI